GPAEGADLLGLSVDVQGHRLIHGHNGPRATHESGNHYRLCSDLNLAVLEKINHKNIPEQSLSTRSLSPIRYKVRKISRKCNGVSFLRACLTWSSPCFRGVPNRDTSSPRRPHVALSRSQNAGRSPAQVR